ncbi:hypothetical protein ACJIZ3_013653 [Penstemon smallii]|uniref:Uncharacterized protein n=1 Tax=Penstemon smallii TaxID=265156 RepID=A0ABD3RU79_9LAMI
MLEEWKMQGTKGTFINSKLMCCGGYHFFKLHIEF